jgi:hypothetical protein
MKKTIITLVLIITISVLTGCSITVDRYNSTADNQNRLRKLNIKLNVDKFTATKSDFSVMCRLANGVNLPDGKSFEKYIEDAFIEELKMADVYSKNSHIILKGHLNDTDVSSGFTDAHWTFNLKVSNGAGESYTIIHKRKYKSSFLGGIACGNDMPKSFLPTIQELVGKVINHPKFDGLFKEKKI